MSFTEFYNIYVNSNEDARTLIEETLENLRIQSVSQAEDTDIDNIILGPLS